MAQSAGGGERKGGRGPSMRDLRGKRGDLFRGDSEETRLLGGDRGVNRTRRTRPSEKKRPSFFFEVPSYGRRYERKGE